MCRFNRALPAVRLENGRAEPPTTTSPPASTQDQERRSPGRRPQNSSCLKAHSTSQNTGQLQQKTTVSHLELESGILRRWSPERENSKAGTAGHAKAFQLQHCCRKQMLSLVH